MLYSRSVCSFCLAAWLTTISGVQSPSAKTGLFLSKGCSSHKVDRIVLIEVDSNWIIGYVSTTNAVDPWY